MRQILHVDMDAFFASVEELDDPSLRGKPVLVGGASRRGVVAAASYAARVFGARSAMPMAEALRRCPDAVVLPPRHKRYAEVSERVFAILGRYTPLVEGLSLDEAFLDVTGSRELFGDGESIARRIKAAIRSELDLIASAGVAPCKFAAKIASDLQKPDGLTIVPPDDVAGFLSPLPIERMWGVGPKTAALLHAAGYETIGDLARSSVAKLETHFGPAWAGRVHALARGDDDRPVVPHRGAESVSAEETFEDDLTSRSDIELKLLGQASRVAQRLLDAGLLGDVVVVKLKYADFTLQTRRTTLQEPVMDSQSIYEAAKALLDGFPLPGKRVRLTGVSVSGLERDAGRSLSLFPDPGAARRRKLEEVMKDVTHRFGEGGLTRAALLGRGRGK